MAAEIRFHFDECVHQADAEGLRRRSIDVTTTWEAGLSSADDSDQLAHATEQQRVLVTQDSDFLRLAGEGKHHSGVAYYIPGSRTVGELVRQLVLLHAVLQPEEMIDRVEFL